MGGLSLYAILLLAVCLLGAVAIGVAVFARRK
jgi:hypothetical protein